MTLNQGARHPKAKKKEQPYLTRHWSEASSYFCERSERSKADSETSDDA